MRLLEEEPLAEMRRLKDLGYQTNKCDSITIYDRTNRIIWNLEMGTDPYPYYESILKNKKTEETNDISHVNEVIQMELLGLTIEIDGIINAFGGENGV